MAASRAAATSLAGRAVHIKIHPRPRNLHESRQILRVLERFGEVVMYKNLRVGVSISPHLHMRVLSLVMETGMTDSTTFNPQYESQVPAPNTALAIYGHATSASNLINASPVRFTLQETTAPAPTPLHQPGPFAIEDDEVDAALNAHRAPGKPGAEEMLAEHTPTGRNRSPASANAGKPERTEATASKHSAARAPTPASVREFQVTANLSTFNHQAYIERQAHYGGFNVDLKSLVAEDLAASVPLLGLADILARKVEVPGRILSRRAEELGKMKSLREVWEEGMGG